jgi:UDP-glucose 4-epimerase
VTGCEVTAITRGAWRHPSGRVRSVAVGDLVEAHWPDGVCADTDAVVHAAAITRWDPSASAPRLFAVNAEAAASVARQAVCAGVKRFVFLSSIKVNGEATAPGRPFGAHDAPAPEDAYGHSKLQAELGLLRALADETGLDLVIIRPSLVYGPGVGGNFAQLVRWVQRGLPLPFGAVDNKRTLIALPNLIDLITATLTRAGAANQILLAGDAEDVSMPELLKGIGAALGRPVRLLPLPPSVLATAASLLDKQDMARKLLGSLQLDTKPTCERLDWSPPLRAQDALRAAVRGWRHG